MPPDCDFRGLDVTGCSFNKADLSPNVLFNGIAFQTATFTGANMPPFTNARDLDIAEHDFSNCDFSKGVTVTGSCLQGVLKYHFSFFLTFGLIML